MKNLEQGLESRKWATGNGLYGRVGCAIAHQNCFAVYKECCMELYLEGAQLRTLRVVRTYASMSLFISLTALSSPSNTDRAMMLWPILSSSMVSIWAMGVTLW